MVPPSSQPRKSSHVTRISFAAMFILRSGFRVQTLQLKVSQPPTLLHLSQIPLLQHGSTPIHHKPTLCKNRVLSDQYRMAMAKQVTSHMGSRRVPMRVRMAEVRAVGKILALTLVIAIRQSLVHSVLHREPSCHFLFSFSSPHSRHDFLALAHFGPSTSFSFVLHETSQSLLAPSASQKHTKMRSRRFFAIDSISHRSHMRLLSSSLAGSGLRELYSPAGQPFYPFRPN